MRSAFCFLFLCAAAMGCGGSDDSANTVRVVPPESLGRAPVAAAPADTGSSVVRPADAPSKPAPTAPGKTPPVSAPTITPPVQPPPGSTSPAAGQPNPGQSNDPV